MRIAFVSPYITSDFVSESYYNVQAFGLARAIAEKGANVRIFTVRKEEDPSRRVLDGGTGSISVRYMHGNIRMRRRPLMNPSLVKELRNGCYDVVQATEDSSPTSLMLGTFMNFIRSKFVLYQGLYRIPNGVLARAYSELCDAFFSGAMVRSVDAVIAKTTAAAEYMSRRGYRNVSTIPVGIDTSTFRPMERNDCRKVLNLDEDSIVLLYVGSIVPSRDVETCVESLVKLREDGVKSKLLLVGTGLHLNEIMELARLRGVSEHVHSIGRIRNKELPIVYNAANVTLLPMKRHALFIFGMVILESLACGVPVVSVPVPAARDHVRDGQNGYLASYEDSDSMADRILRIVTSDESMRKMSHSARRYCEDSLDWRVLADRYMSVYRSC